MATLIYSAIASLDGYIEDATGDFEWAAPDEELHAFVNELERPIGTYLYGRRMYETMRFWQTAGADAGDPATIREFAEIWRAAEKVVYSRSLGEVTTPRTRLERALEPEAIRQLKAASVADLSIGGAELAATAFAGGLVDECHLFLGPIVVGSGKRALPAGIHIALELLAERRFASGVVHLHYRIRQQAGSRGGAPTGGVR
jgi:dihydrofolate reductase